MKRTVMFIVLTLLAYSCEEKDCCQNLEHKSTYFGRWILAETGHSPGSGYIVEEVPSEPPQTIELRPDGSMISNIEEFEEFSHYDIDREGVADHFSIRFFRADTDDEIVYSLVIEGDSLKLYYRYCIEGCHLGFVRMF